jgi:hypothetical protein
LLAASGSRIKRSETCAELAAAQPRVDLSSIFGSICRSCHPLSFARLCARRNICLRCNPPRLRLSRSSCNALRLVERPRASTTLTRLQQHRGIGAPRLGRLPPRVFRVTLGVFDLDER